MHTITIRFTDVSTGTDAGDETRIYDVLSLESYEEIASESLEFASGARNGARQRRKRYEVEFMPFSLDDAADDFQEMLELLRKNYVFIEATTLPRWALAKYAAQLDACLVYQDDISQARDGKYIAVTLSLHKRELE